jgi:hypothetical protein
MKVFPSRLRVIRCVGSALLVVVAACKGKGAAPQKQRPTDAQVAVVADATAPDAAPACVPRGDLRAVAVEQAVRICGKGSCVDVDGQGALHAAPRGDIAEQALTAATIEDRGGKLAACFHDKCRQLGKAATALITKDPDVNRDALSATVDLGLLVIPKVSPQLWSIADDKEIHLRGPGGEKELDELRPVGNNLLAVWLPPVEAMYGRNGRLLASLFSSGTQLAMIDDTTSVALTPDHRVFVFGTETHAVDLVPSVGFDDWVKEAGALAVLPDKTVAVVLVRSGGEASVIFIDPARGTVFRRWPLALCPG